jgi:hypothetical protein
MSSDIDLYVMVSAAATASTQVGADGDVQRAVDFRRTEIYELLSDHYSRQSSQMS